MKRKVQRMEHVAQWDFLELCLDGPATGNPYLEVEFSAHFCFGHRVVEVAGFYNGDGTYKVRFMPDVQGEWRYTTSSNREELSGRQGTFVCTEPTEGNRGPVHVERKYHFAYADGTPHFSFGTTCYAWTHQEHELEEQTLQTLAEAPFNKMRMCLFPKHYSYNRNEPEFYPFVRDDEGKIDLTQFSPAFWSHFETRLGQLRDLGIEANLILFHPYDRWGHADMAPEVDDRFLRYAVARLAAFRNVWWSMANEYDLMKSKSMADWDRFFKIVQQADPYQRLRGVHNCRGFYDHAKPWVTHASVQHSELDRVGEWRRQYGKPVVVDECCYEGNIEHGWGNISAREMVHRFWLGTVQGGYVGHGETYLHPEDVLWWSRGGLLHGQSPARIAFLRSLVEAGPALGIEPQAGVVRFPCVGKAPDYYLAYFGIRQPAKVGLDLPAEGRFRVESIDTWEMKMEVASEGLSGRCEIALVGKPFMAIRITKSADAA